MTGYVEGRVLRWKKWDTGLATLVVEAPVDPFQPGQFFQLALDREGELVRRSYSVASAPGAQLEFYLTKVEGGALSPALFALREGDTVLVDRTARGFFTLEYVPKVRRLWLVATGTGLGPYIAMLRTEATFEHAEEIVVVHGVRSHAQLGYRAELEELAAERALRDVPGVSREEPREGVLGGRITAALSSGALERAAGRTLNPADSHVLLCGNPAMIKDMMTSLGERGLERHRVRKPGHITVEKYW